MKILLTGVTGFLGSHLAVALLGQGHEVLGLKRRQSDISRLTALVDQIQLIDSDDGLELFFEGTSDINLIIHAATSYGHHQELPSNIVAANVVMPLKLLEWAVTQHTCAFINTDTFFCKANNTYQHLSSYIATKKLFLELSTELVNANNATFCNMCIEHMYGPRDGDHKFTTTMVQQMLDGVPEINLTPGQQIRDFVHVDDVVEAYLSVVSAIQSKSISGATHFEVGSGESHTVRDFVTMAHQIAESKSRLVFGGLPYRENEIMNSKANLGALRALGWHPRVKLEPGIRSFVESCRTAGRFSSSAIQDIDEEMEL